MRKRSKRRVRAACEPAMVMLYNTPEIGLCERMAISHLQTGFADYENCYRVLADCHGLLTIAAREGEESLVPASNLGAVALLNIFDRMNATGKVGATGDELNALKAMIDVAEDYWKRGSTNQFLTAISKLNAVRASQIAEKRRPHVQP